MPNKRLDFQKAARRIGLRVQKHDATKAGAFEHQAWQHPKVSPFVDFIVREHLFDKLPERRAYLRVLFQYFIDLRKPEMRQLLVDSYVLGYAQRYKIPVEDAKRVLAQNVFGVIQQRFCNLVEDLREIPKDGQPKEIAIARDALSQRFMVGNYATMILDRLKKSQIKDPKTTST